MITVDITLNINQSQDISLTVEANQADISLNIRKTKEITLIR